LITHPKGPSIATVAATAAGPGNDFKSQVLGAVNIVDLIGQTVGLKRRGKDYVGLCPFHTEKTPSFHVNPSKQFFHCYGCKASGNAIDFVMKRDRVEFIDALRSLGESVGLEMPRSGGAKQKSGERQILFDANSAACAFFEKLLSHPDHGAPARAYLEKRGINADSIQRFQVGLAIDSWNALLTSPIARKFTPQQLALAGLAKPNSRGDGFYDTFRNRLIFPIRDEAGRVTAFGGRVLPGSEDPAKYLNSPETAIFSKSRTVFGLDLARQRIVETRTVAVVEGYTDVVVSHQFGASNVVSVLGTAMTEHHVATLRRFADRIVLLFDADAAGDSAVDRAVELFLHQPVEISIASIPDGLDPDEFLLRDGREAFDALLSSASDALSYKWKQLVRQFMRDKNDLTGQQKAVEEYLTLLSSSRGTGPIDSLRWGAALARVSRLTEIPIDALNRRFKSTRSPVRAANAPPTSSPQPSQSAPQTAHDRAERWILGVLLAEPDRWHDVQHHVHVSDFVDENRQKLAQLYWATQRDEGEPVFHEFLGLLGESNEPALKDLAVELVDEVGSLPDLDQTLAGAIESLQAERRRREELRLIAESRHPSAGQENQEDDAVAMIRKLQEMARQPDVRRGKAT